MNITGVRNSRKDILRESYIDGAPDLVVEARRPGIVDICIDPAFSSIELTSARRCEEVPREWSPSTLRWLTKMRAIEMRTHGSVA